jgi:hypothetical protein
MKLIVEPLGETFATLEQKITPSKNTFVTNIRPHVYKHNLPTGDLRVKILDSSMVLLATSNAVTIASIDSAFSSDDFVHAYIKFDVEWGLQKDTDYFIQLSTEGGYSFAEGAYMGWCKDYDLRKYTASYTGNVGMNSSYDMEIWEKRKVEKGVF